MRSKFPCRWIAIALALAGAACIALPAASEISGRSATHKLAQPVKPPDAAARPVYYQNPPAPLGLAASGDGWSVYSRGVNRFNAVEKSGAETWLATDAGIKLIDRAHGTVTHYTRLDGLPDDKVLAVAAGPDAAWAIVETKKGEIPTATLCELKRGGSRWRSIHEAPRPILAVSQRNADPNGAYALGAPLETSFVSACPEKLCVAQGPIRIDDRAFASCFDRRLNTWDDIPAFPAAFASRTMLSITWMSVDRDGIWMATTGGLLRYLLREKTWKRFLSDRMVYAAVKAEDGTLWLASYAPPPAEKSTTPAQPAAREPTGTWFVTRLAVKTGAVTDYAVPFAGARPPAYGMPLNPTFSGISIVDHSIWLSPGARRPYGGPAPYFQLGSGNGSWRSYAVQSVADLDPIPDAALAQPTLPRATLICAFYPWRLTDWTCREMPDPPQDSVARSVPQNHDSDGTVWSTDGRTVTQSDAKGVMLKRFSVSKIQVPVTPQINAVTVMNNTLYATVNGDVEAFDFGSETWTRIRMPRNAWSNPADDRLIPLGDRLLVSTPANIFRYDPVSRLFSTEASSQNGGFRMIGAAADAIWLRGPDNLLYRPDPASGDPKSVEPAPLPPDIAAKYDRGQPFAYVGGIVWFRLPERMQQQKQLVIGYDPTAHSWTPGRPTASPYPNPPTCVAHGSRIYFPTVDQDASICAYDKETRAWSIIAPKAPMGKGETTLTLISADDLALWALDGSNRCLLCFNRQTSAWSANDFPQNIWVNQYGNEGTLAGNAIYLATSNGVWKFSISTHGWSQLPGFASRDMYLSGITVSPAGIWSIARPNNGNQAFAARMDKAAGQWSVWGEREGFPERGYPNTVMPSGDTAWVLAGAVCFRLDAAANRWDDVSARLAQPIDQRPSGPLTIRPDLSATPYLEVAEVVPDPDGAWILPRRVLNAKDKATERALLVRFDARTSRYEMLTPSPDPGPNVVGSSMQVEHDAIWVPTGDGVFRFNRSDRTWKRVDPPAAAMLWGKMQTLQVVEKSGEKGSAVQHVRRFYGSDTAIEWKD